MKNMELQKGYWQSKFKDGIPAMELPLDHQRPPVQSFIRKKEAHAFSGDFYKQLKWYADQKGISVFALLLSGFNALLSRYTGSDDIVVGSVVHSPDEDAARGASVPKLVALRSKVDGETTGQQLMQRTEAAILEAENNAGLPFEFVARLVTKKIGSSGLVFFNTAFIFSGSSDKQSDALSFRDQEYLSQCDIVFYAEDSAGGIQINCEYDAEILDAGTIGKMLNHFRSLLSGIMFKSDARISELTLLSIKELIEMNQTAKTEQDVETPNTCIHHFFENQVNRTPNFTALTFKNTDITYEELNARANQLAHLLQKKGIGPEKIVGLYLDRSIEMIVAILAVLKAGGAYLPMDLSYPEERCEFMLNDSAAEVVLTTSTRQASLPATAGIEVISLDTDWQHISREAATNPQSNASPENLAYIIYTSGSTGQPKGVEVTHQNVMRLFSRTFKWFWFNEQDVWTLFHSYAFDFSVWEIWGALFFGGRLVIVPQLTTRSPEAFHDLLVDEGVTILNQTPSAFQQLVEADAKAERSDELTLRQIIFGGEKLDFNSLRPWIDKHGDKAPDLINMYGITETTVHVTYRRVTADDAYNSTGSFIGQPIDDLEIYILAQNQQPLPSGVSGEIYVGGAGVARGYLNRPQLTADRFIPNPFSNQPDARLYRTGDLGRRLSNGELEYLGRVDSQVKIRGFRIELGEIQSAISAHPDVKQAAVIAREDIPGRKQLVAYYIPETSAGEQAPDFNTFLQKRLPDYMKPAACIALEAFPLTDNGKLNEKALPAPAEQHVIRETNFSAPENDLEASLAKLWSSVLKLERVSCTANFFEIGGDSLLIVQLNRLLKDTLDRDIPVTTLFQYPTIRTLATHLANKENASESDRQKITDRAELQRAAALRRRKLMR